MPRVQGTLLQQSARVLHIWPYSEQAGGVPPVAGGLPPISGGAPAAGVPAVPAPPVPGDPPVPGGLMVPQTP